jgi:nicotinamidase-related amidase
MNPNMANLTDLISQSQPSFQTNQALLVIGLQNDFLLPDGRLPVETKNGFLERIQTLIPKFRELSGNVIWVQTLYEADRIATGADTGEGDALVVGGLIDGDESDTAAGEEELAKEAATLPAQSRSSKHKQRALAMLKRVAARRKAMPKEVARAAVEEDEELFLLQSETRSPACVPDTGGAEFADVIARQFELPADMVVKATNYSAFQGTNLLMTLRARLVTELFICGCITNVSVLATVIDAARHGIKICVIEDCLGFRKQNRHELALKRMEEFFSAYLVNSVEILARDVPETPKKSSTSLNGVRTSQKNSEIIEAAMSKMNLGNDGRPGSRTSNPRSPSRVLSGKQRTLSLVSAAESRKAAQNPPVPAKELATSSAAEPSDKEFADLLVKGAIVPPVGKDENKDEGGQEEEKEESQGG